MKTIIYFFFSLVIIAIGVIFSELYLRNSGVLPLMPTALIISLKWFIIIFNGIAVLFALPLFAGKRNAVAFYNKTAGNSSLWGMMRALSFTYMLVWVVWMSVPLDLMTGSHIFHYTHDYFTGNMVYNLPFFGKYVVEHQQWNIMFMIGFVGILGVKASFLIATWAGKLQKGELEIDHYGRIWC